MIAATFPRLYLASASPRRHELLLQVGIDHEVLDVPSPPGEDEPRLPGEAPVDYVQRTAHEKALRAVAWVAQQALPERPILCADTTVALGDDILGKPANSADAALLLRRLSGSEHTVYTAIVLAHGGQLHHALSASQVRFQALSEAEIAAYCATGEPMGKAGAYGIQGKAAMFVAHLSGSHSGVVGLPLHETYALLASVLTTHEPVHHP